MLPTDPMRAARRSLDVGLELLDRGTRLVGEVLGDLVEELLQARGPARVLRRSAVVAALNAVPSFDPLGVSFGAIQRGARRHRRTDLPDIDLFAVAVQVHVDAFLLDVVALLRRGVVIGANDPVVVSIATTSLNTTTGSVTTLLSNRQNSTQRQSSSMTTEEEPGKNVVRFARRTLLWEFPKGSYRSRRRCGREPLRGRRSALDHSVVLSAGGLSLVAHRHRFDPVLALFVRRRGSVFVCRWRSRRLLFHSHRTRVHRKT